jgi:hypothetical protein
MPVIVSRPRVEDELPRAIGANHVIARDPQVHARVAERPITAIAAHIPAVDVKYLGDVGDGRSIRHFGTFLSSAMVTA